MSLHFCTVLCCLFSFQLALKAQVNLSFGGLKRTKLTYIAINLDQLSISPQSDTLLVWNIDPSAVDAASLADLRQNLINLPQIQQAEPFSNIIQEGGNKRYEHIHWKIREARTISPMLSFGGIKGNINWLVGINDQHLFGLGHEVQAFYQNIQGEHNYLVSYKNPSLRHSRFGLTLESRRYAAIEPVYFDNASADYRYVNQNFGVGTSYRLKQRQWVNIGFTFFRETFDLREVDNQEADVPLAVSFDKLLIKTGHTEDRRNFKDERIQGTFNSTILEVVLNPVDKPFAIAWHELAYFHLIGARGNLALRTRLGFASNRDSPFAPFALDSQLNIRGSGNRIDRGTAQFVLNAEFRHRIWKDKKDNFSSQFVVFSDLGTWRAPGGAFRELTDGSTLQHFVGGGLRLISSKAKNTVLRLDYGIDWRTPEQQGLVFGVGQYF